MSSRRAELVAALVVVGSPGSAAEENQVYQTIVGSEASWNDR